MFSKYKFFDEKRKHYKDLSLIDPNDDRDEGMQIYYQDQEEMSDNKRELINQCSEMIENNESPRLLLEQFFPDKYPEFDYFFLENFIQYYQNQGPDCDFLMSKIVFSSKKNAFVLGTFGIFDRLYLKAPESLDIIFKIVESNKQSIKFFINSGGVFVLAAFSNINELQLKISQFFLYISNSEFNFEKNFIPPVDFLIGNPNYDHSNEINYEFFFSNLLFSPIPDVQKNCMKSIENIIVNPQNKIQTNFIIFIQNQFDILIDTFPYLIPFILDISFNFDVFNSTEKLLNACHSIFQNNIESGVKPALFFISKDKNIEFICEHDEISEFIFNDLILYIKNGSFEISMLSTCVVAFFLTMCSPSFYGRSFESCIFQYISNVLFSMNPTCFEASNFGFLIDKLEFFLNKLSMVAVRPNLSEQGESLCELIEALQPYTSYGDQGIASSASHCITLIQSFLE